MANIIEMEDIRLIDHIPKFEQLCREVTATHSEKLNVNLFLRL